MLQSVSNIKLIITFFMLWATSFLSPRLEDYLAYFMILTVGLLHGSNDIELLFKNYKLKRSKFYLILIFYNIIDSSNGFLFLSSFHLSCLPYLFRSVRIISVSSTSIRKLEHKSPLRDFFFLSLWIHSFFYVVCLE